MRRSQYRRESKNSKWFTGRRRIIAAAATLVAFGGIVTVTQVSDASTKRNTQNRALASCNSLQAPKRSNLSTETKRGTYTTNKGKVTQHADDGAGDVPTTEQMRTRCREWVKGGGGKNNGGGNNNGGNNNGGNTGGASPAPSGSTAVGEGNNGGNTGGGNTGGGNNGGGNNGGGGGSNNNGGNTGGASPAPSGSTAVGEGNNGGGNNNGGNNGGGNNNGGNNGGGNNGGNNGGGNNNGGGAVTPPPGAGLGILSNTCEDSQLQPHDGFQLGDRCVSTEFGEVSAAANNPSLLITEAPTEVGVNEAFTLRVSTRNLIRDRFLAAGQGGYYVERSVLAGGLTRGHFHTACRVLNSTDEAPDAAPVPAFFVATEDRQGGAAPDTVTIQVPGLPNEGLFQCASWAGDGSHRIPMMERANETPAFDAVRITVGNAGGDNGGEGDNNNN